MTQRDIVYARASDLRTWVRKQRVLGNKPTLEEILDRLRSNTGIPLTPDEEQWVMQHSEPALVRRRQAKAVAPSPSPSAPTALATIKSAVKEMAHQSPPPGFRAAIPLREAIDTVNAYVVEEGDALELTISKRGRLKVRYEYGG